MVLSFGTRQGFVPFSQSLNLLGYYYGLMHTLF